ncbi:MAG: chromosome segregation protein SMC [Sphingomonadales bacterium]
MVHFKRLRLSGFKSFVEPTELWIEPGLTGVVGPNGCGKSNLLEALRWVMGESSPKSMRGGGMEDVIFAGTSNRPARNLADVSLLIDNRERKAPAEFNNEDDLEISRRIERDVGSAYRINGRDVRQKDVQLLFADAATGAHSPALVSQGRIGNLITAKPVQRRQLLEEAAGISGLHARRKEAEQRLRAAENNLLRLQDVMEQMTGQLASLKRQARQAERYRKISGDVRSVEAMLLYSRWKLEATKLEEAERALKQADALVAEITTKSSSITKAQTEIAARLPDLRKAEAEASAALTRLKVAREGLDAEEARLETMRQELSQRLTQIDQDSSREAEMALDAAAALERLAKEREELDAQLAKSEDHLKDVSAKVKAAEEAASEAETLLDKETQQMASAQAKQETSEGAVRATERRLTRLNEERAQLEDQFKRLNAGDDDSRALEEAEKRQTELESSYAAAQEQQSNVQKQLNGFEQERDTARKAWSETESLMNKIGAEISALESILNSGEFQGDYVPVSEQLDVKKGYEKALGAALGDDLEAAIQDGPKYWDELPPLPQSQSLPTAAKPLSDYVKAPQALARRLSQIGVVDADKGATAAVGLLAGQRLVTLEGALWRWDGFTASAEAPTSASIRLAQRNRLMELQAQMAKAESVEAKARAKHEAARAQVDETRTKLAEARTQENKLSQQLNENRRTLARLSQAAQEKRTKSSALEAGLERINEDFKTAEREAEEARIALEQLPQLDGLQTVLEKARAAAGEKRTELSDARSAFDRLHREKEFALDRKEAVNREEAAWKSRVERAGEQQKTLAERKIQVSAALRDLENRPAEIAERREKLLSQVQQAEEERNKAADRLAKVENELGEQDRLAKLVNEDLLDAREKRVRIDAEMEAHGERKRDIAHDIGQAFNCPPPLVLQQVGIEDEDNLPTLDVLEHKLERYKAERERLGAVNLRADIELQEISEQLEHMGSEKTDLESAIARLRAGINNLNREGRERLLQAFNEVNAHFSELFTTLFGGGHAYLELIESDDPLEAGLEILASPPGKRLQSLSLLSGGEQALTALSLIFAVFMTNPAPICVLDEVDAPLDDANVERFCNLLDEMTRLTNTRFLIVTHNAVTMSRMDRLFGVTMAERGVSQLVSVDLSTAEELRAAE